MAIKPILFNTEMVRAILDGRKTVTRRIIKHDVKGILNSPYHQKHPEVTDAALIERLCRAKYQPGDILYVRETWSEWTGGYLYKAWNGPFPQPGKALMMRWHPSIHMPKEAARIFLRVTGVHVERLQEMSYKDCLKEGIAMETTGVGVQDIAEMKFRELWDSTIKKADLALYGWQANPWVWVIEFERCEKPAERR